MFAGQGAVGVGTARQKWQKKQGAKRNYVYEISFLIFIEDKYKNEKAVMYKLNVSNVNK